MIWLTSLPAAVLVAGGLALALLIALGSRLALRALIPAAERDGAYGIAAPLMPALGAMFGILIALSLASEASPGVGTAPIHSALLGYLRATRADEWHGNSAADGNDPATVRAIAGLERAVRAQADRPALGTPMSTELLASLDALTSDRRARLAAASRELPALYVVVLVVSGAALIANATVLTLRGGWRPALLVGGLSVVVGLSIALLFALGTPWRGPITVSGQPIDSVVRDLSTGYFHP